MTDAAELSVEQLSQLIAAQGREALVERLRIAYTEAAAAHADIVSLDERRIEALVQNAANHADGLQWRRALAGVASRELGVSVAEALSHPAVVRAQKELGAPSYEQSLTELITQPIPAPLPPVPVRETAPGAPAGAPIEPHEWDDEPDEGLDEEPVTVIEGQLELAPEPPAPEPLSETPPPEPPAPEEEPVPEDSLSDELEVIEADDTMVELLPEPDPVELDTPLHQTVPLEADVVEVEAEAEAPPEVEAPAEAEALPAVDAPAVEPPLTAEPPPAEAVEELRINAIHLGGVANLPTNREGLDLRLSAEGLDIMRGQDEIIGRLIWDEIEALEVPNQRRRRRGGQPAQARLVVRTRHGDASFEVPGYSSDELRDRVDLRLESYARH